MEPLHLFRAIHLDLNFEIIFSISFSVSNFFSYTASILFFLSSNYGIMVIKNDQLGFLLLDIFSFFK